MQPTSSPVKVGVIGIGNMGWHHARVLSLLKDANLIGVADPNEERGKLAIEQFQCEWFKDYKDLIPKVDAICIIEAANASNCLLQVGHIERFNPAFRELNKIVNNEEIVVLEARRHSPHADRANDVSVVMDLMIHDIDLILELVNSKIQKLAAVGGRNSEGLIDYVNATLVFKNNVIASLTASKMSHKKIRSLSAHCQNGLVETDFLNHSLQIHRKSHESYTAEHGELVYRNDGYVEEVSTTSIEPLYAELEHFLKCVQGKEIPEVDGEQASRALKIADFIESAVDNSGDAILLELAASINDFASNSLAAIGFSMRTLVPPLRQSIPTL